MKWFHETELQGPYLYKKVTIRNSFFATSKTLFFICNSLPIYQHIQKVFDPNCFRGVHQYSLQRYIRVQFKFGYPVNPGHHWLFINYSVIDIKVKNISIIWKSNIFEFRSKPFWEFSSVIYSSVVIQAGSESPNTGKDKIEFIQFLKGIWKIILVKGM